jgi:hypothetical protein
MNKVLALIVISVALVVPSGFSLADPAPHQVGGFILGADIDKFRDKLQMDTVLRERSMTYLKTVETKPIPGFKSGVIFFGACTSPERIVRIDLKYADSSKQFYFQLLDRFKKRFGEPDVWRGDPFKVMLAWKWSFKDSKNNDIGLILQHNTKDEDERMGNVVKIRMTNLIDRERRCQEKAEAREKGAQSSAKEASGRADWRLLIPK